MTIALNRIPEYNDTLTKQGATTRGWYTFFLGLLKGQPTGNVAGITVGTTPFTYIAPTAGSVIVQGGSTTQIQFSRDGVTKYITGQTTGMFPLSQGDSLIVTYPVAPPTITFVPQ